MALKCREMAQKILAPGDSVKKTFEGKFDGSNGYLLMSNQRLLFFKEEGGFLNKAYNQKLDLPYDKIDKFIRNGSYQLDIVEVEGKKHEFRTLDISIAVIQQSFEELVQKKTPLIK